MPPRCSYFQCKCVTGQKPMFRFPVRDQRRLPVWINNCGNTKITHLPEVALRHRYICSDHFDKRFIKIKVDGQRVRLSKLAVPIHYQEKKPEEISSNSSDVTSQDNKYFKVLRSSEPERKVLTPVPKACLFEDYAIQRWIDQIPEDSIPYEPDDDQQCPELTIQKPDKVYQSYHKQVCEELAKDHYNVRLCGKMCVECKRIIYGFHWWCVQCAGARCSRCALRMAHRAHYLLRAPTHSSHDEMEAVLAAIRQHMGDDLLQQPDIRHVDEKGVDLSLAEEPEVKVEPPEVEDPFDPLACPPVDPLAWDSADPLADCKPEIKDIPLSEPSIDYQPVCQKVVDPMKPGRTIRPLGVEIYSPAHPGLESYELSLAQCSGIDFISDRLGDFDSDSQESDSQSNDEDHRPPSAKRGNTYTGYDSEDSLHETDYEPSCDIQTDEQDETRPWVRVLSSQEQNNTVTIKTIPKTNKPQIQAVPTKQNILAKQQNIQKKRPWVQVFSNIKQKEAAERNDNTSKTFDIDDIQESSNPKQKDNNSSDTSRIEESCGEQTCTANERTEIDRLEPMDQDNSEEQISVPKKRIYVTAKRKKRIIIVKKRPCTKYPTHIQRDFEPTDHLDSNPSAKENETLNINVTSAPTNNLLNLENIIRERVSEYPPDIEELS